MWRNMWRNMWRDMWLVHSNGQARTAEAPPYSTSTRSTSPSCIPVGQRPYLGGVEEVHLASTMLVKPASRNFLLVWSDYSDLTIFMTMGVIISRPAFFHKFLGVR